MVLSSCCCSNEGIEKFYRKKNIYSQIDLKNIVEDAFKKENSNNKIEWTPYEYTDKTHNKTFHGQSFGVNGSKYWIATYKKFTQYSGTVAGEEIVALCKDEFPLIATRHYSLVYEDSADETEFFQGPKGDEVYLFNYDKLARRCFNMMKTPL